MGSSFYAIVPAMELPPLLLIDKPNGMTSFDVIRELRRRSGVRKFGHAGTLDPLATGLMLLGVNEGTKQLATLTKLDKEYVAEIRLGERRSTGDLEGKVLEQKPVTNSVSATALDAALQTLVGTHTYRVSAYSAIKKNGVPMYKRARAAEKRGEVVEEVLERAMTVYEVDLVENHRETVDGVPMQIVTVRFVVASGTYIRSLAEAFGKKLGYPATLQTLRRTKVGEYCVENAQQLTDFET